MARRSDRFVPTTEEITLLSACHDAPEELSPRLALADWLDQRGDPRGEMVRLSATNDRLPWDARSHDRARADEILRSLRGPWLGRPPGSWSVHSGLLHAQLMGRSLAGKSFPVAAGAALDSGWVERLSIQSARNEDLTADRVGAVRSLGLCGSPHLGDGGLAFLGGLERLQELSLSSEKAVRGPGLRHLHRLPAPIPLPGPEPERHGPRPVRPVPAG